MIIERTVHTVGHKREKPSVYFNPMAQPTSTNPATTRTIQFMFPLNGLKNVAHEQALVSHVHVLAYGPFWASFLSTRKILFSLYPRDAWYR